MANIMVSEPEVSSQPDHRSQRILGLRGERCIGCKSCEMACSMAKTGTYDLALSRIHVESANDDKLNFKITTCLQCAEPKCVEACPADCMSKDPVTGTITIDHDECVLCEACVEACPFGGVVFSAKENKILKCDYCDGSPECAKACPTGAIEDINAIPLFTSLYKREDLASPGLSACLGCNMELLVRFTMKIIGRNMVFASGPSCAAGTGLAGYGVTNGSKVPIYHSLLDNYPSMISGTKRYYDMIGKEFHAVCFVGDGGTADVGFQALSGAAERGENLIYICYDNEGYMNTGIQRSGTTPRGAWTTTTPVGKNKHGKMQHKKDVALIMAMHDIPFAATANTVYMDDYARKLRHAMEVKDGFSYIHVFSPCPTGWRFPSDQTTEIARLAVETNFSPLWEMDHGKFKLSKEIPFPKPVEQYLRTMGKFSHLTREDIDEMQKEVDRRYERLVALTKI